MPEVRLICIIATVCGVMGVLGGFALDLFIVGARHERLTFTTFLIVLAIAAVVARITEYIREVIQSPGHARRELVSLRSWGISLCLVALFEIYVIAFHDLPKVEFRLDPGRLATQAQPQESTIGTTIPVPNSINPSPAPSNEMPGEAAPEAKAPQEDSDAPLTFAPIWEQLLLLAIWTLVGIGLAVTLSLLPRQLQELDQPKVFWTCVLRGLFVAGLLGPGLAFAAIVAIRLSQTIFFMISNPHGWQDHLNGLVEGNSHFFYWPTRGFAWLHGLLLKYLGSLAGWISLAAMVGVVAVYVRALLDERNHDVGCLPIVVLLSLVMAFLSPWLSAQIFLPPLIIFLVFLIPSILLGAIVPWLQEPGTSWRLWGPLALLVAIVLMVLTALRLVEGQPWVVLAVALMGLLAILAFFGLAKEAWPLIAVCMALCVVGATRLSQFATFAGTLGQVHEIVHRPLSFSISQTKPLPGPVEDYLRRGGLNGLGLEVDSAEEWNSALDSLKMPTRTWDSLLNPINPRPSNLFQPDDDPQRRDPNSSFGSRLREFLESERRAGAEPDTNHPTENPRPLTATDIENQQLEIAREMFNIGKIPQDAPLAERAETSKALSQEDSAHDSSQQDPAIDQETEKPNHALPKKAISQTEPTEQLEDPKVRIMRQELCFVASFGFWITISVMASWALLGEKSANEVEHE